MGERTVAVGFYNWLDDDGIGHTAVKGETVDFTEDAEEKGDRYGAFTDSPAPGEEGRPEAVDPVAYAFPEGPEPPLAEEDYEVADSAGFAGDPRDAVEEPEDEDAEATEQDANGDNVDSLSGQDLEDACAEEGIDTSTGGSLASGAMSADEKRAALRAARG